MICRVQNPPVTLGVGYLGLFGGAQADSAPAAPFATATMLNTGTNVAAAASTSARPPNTCEHEAKRARKAAVLKVRQYIQLEQAMYTCAPTCRGKRDGAEPKMPRAKPHP